MVKINPDIIEARLLEDKIQTKTCAKCGEEKPRLEFANSGKNPSTGRIYRRPECKPCWYVTVAEREAEKKATDPDYVTRIKEAKRKSARARYDPLKQKALTYGISVKQIEEMFDSQNKSCKICSLEILKDWHVDHCHQTNEVRGILCRSCNTGLGFFKDNIEVLKKAILYLEGEL